MALRFFLLSLVAAAGALASGRALAGDAAARHVIGFSPDGTVFAFEQYTMLYEDDAAFSEYVVIDTRTDRFAPGTPIKVLIRGDEGLDEKKARGDARKRADPILKKLRVGEPGTRIAGKPSMALDEIGIYQMDPQPLAKSLDVALPDGRFLQLSASAHQIGSATCAGYGGTGTPGKAKTYGLKLTMSLGGAPIILQSDATLPASRRCAADYGIAEAWLHRAADGTLTLAALIEYADNHEYHAGPNRRFMAVTKRLPAR
jgi:predicted secreted protein